MSERIGQRIQRSAFKALAYCVVIGTPVCLAGSALAKSQDSVAEEPLRKLTPQLAAAQKHNGAITLKESAYNERCTLSFYTKSGSFVVARFVDVNRNNTPDSGEVESVMFSSSSGSVNEKATRAESYGTIERIMPGGLTAKIEYHDANKPPSTPSVWDIPQWLASAHQRQVQMASNVIQQAAEILDETA